MRNRWLIAVSAVGIHLFDLADKGIAINPLSLELPDIGAPLETRQAKDLGVLLMRKMADETSYARQGDRNMLTSTIYKN